MRADGGDKLRQPGIIERKEGVKAPAEAKDPVPTIDSTTAKDPAPARAWEISMIFKRIGAITLDIIILWGLSILSSLLLPRIGIDRGHYFLMWFIGFSYFVYFEQSGWQATFGKMIFGLKVEDTFSLRPLLHQTTFRNLWYNALGLPWMMLYAYGVYTVEINKILTTIQIDSRIIINRYEEIVNGTYFVTVVMALIWFVPILFTDNKTGIYELLSDTRVKKAK